MKKQVESLEVVVRGDNMTQQQKEKIIQDIEEWEILVKAMRKSSLKTQSYLCRMSLVLAVLSGALGGIVVYECIGIAHHSENSGVSVYWFIMILAIVLVVMSISNLTHSVKAYRGIKKELKSL